MKQKRHVWRSKGRGTACKHCGVIKRGSGGAATYVVDGTESAKKPKCLPKDGVKVEKPGRAKRAAKVAKAGNRRRKTFAARIQLGPKWPTIAVNACAPMLVNADEASKMLAFETVAQFLEAVGRGDLPQPVRGGTSWIPGEFSTYVLKLRDERNDEIARKAADKAFQESSGPGAAVSPPVATEAAPAQPVDTPKNGSGKKSKKGKPTPVEPVAASSEAESVGSLLSPEPVASAT